MTLSLVARFGLHLGWLAGLAFALAVVLAAKAVPGYDHARHAVALLGAAHSPQAASFNVFGFVMCGLALSGFAAALESRLAPLSRSGRIATGLLLIAGLAFAAQGVLAFDPSDLDGPDSRRHVASYSAALLAWCAAWALLAFALRARPEWRALAAFAGLGTILMLALQWVSPGATWGPGWIQRAQWALFFAWPAVSAWIALRRAHSPL